MPDPWEPGALALAQCGPQDPRGQADEHALA